MHRVAVSGGPSEWRPRVCRFVAAVAGLGFLVALASTGSAAADEVRFGFNDWQVSSQLPLQVELGAPIRRWSVAWNEVETTPEAWNWSRYDAQYQALTAAGLQPLVIARGAPCWAHPSSPCEGAGSAIAADPAFDDAWAEFVRRLAARYPAVVAVEIWNEPNIKPSFSPYPNPARFAALLKAAYPAVKSVDPALPVISGGLFVSRGSGPFGIGNAQFLAGMYTAGAKGYMDGIGIHPYPRTDSLDPTPRVYDPALLDGILAGVRATRDAAGDSATPIWITEIGESTTTMPGFPAAVSERGQASDLVALVRAIRAAPDVRVAIIHRLVDLPIELGGPYGAVEGGFGVFRTDGSPKPAACALSRELGGSLATSVACLDTIRPRAHPPVVELRSDVTLVGDGSAVRARVSWPEAVDDRTAAGDLEYNLQQQIDGGAWRRATGWVSERSADRVLAAGSSYRFRVRVRDAAGNLSRAETGDAVAPSVLAADAGAISYSRAWATNRPTQQLFGGYLRRTSRVGSTATFEFSDRSLGLVMRRASGYGLAQACVADVTVPAPPACTEINLGTDGAGSRRVVFAPSGLDLGHTYELVVTDLDGRIELDAISLLS